MCLPTKSVSPKETHTGFLSTNNASSGHFVHNCHVVLVSRNKQNDHQDIVTTAAKGELRAGVVRKRVCA